jgi:hypothetical protein
MSQFKAALTRNAKNQPDLIMLFSFIVGLMLLIVGIRRARRPVKPPFMQTLVLFIISILLLLIPSIFKVSGGTMFGPGRTRKKTPGAN